ncbi:MAG: glyoxylate/hydroxypyruvate reductase A [Gammaproteobacteria bacterium]
MRAVFISTHDDPAAWKAAMASVLPELELDIWPAVSEPEAIEVALVWKPPPGVLAQFTQLRLICGLGQGVDFLFDDPALPKNVPITRLVDPDLIAQMSEYVCAATLWHHRRFEDYRAFQRAAEWWPLAPPKTSGCRVGILGLGSIGQDIAQKLAYLGFPVQGWSRSPKNLSGIDCFAGDEQLADFLAGCNVVVCVLPLTATTRGILNRQNLACLPPGALVINVARGGHVVEDDLLAALDVDILRARYWMFSGRNRCHRHTLSGTILVVMTPHIAGLTRPETAARQIADNIRRLLQGQPLCNQVEQQRQY